MGIFLGDKPVSVFFNGASASLPVQGVFLGGIQVFPAAAAATDTALLLNFNGENESTTFTDSSPNGFAVTANGDAKISTVQSKFGGASLLLDGISSASVADDEVNQFGSGDFTIEMWAYPAEDQAMTLAAKWDASGDQSWFLGAGDNGYGFYVGEIGLVLPWEEWPEINEWIHVAVARQGSNLRLFVDGVQEGETYDIGDTAIPAASGVPLTVGDDANLGSDGNPAFQGYIDDFRILKGRALYTANFTPPAAQLGVI
jgi:hypothetical protein